MRRLAPLLAAAAFVAAVVPASGEAAPPPYPRGSFTWHTSTATPDYPSRGYWLFVPHGDTHAPRPLLVFLHGCNLSAEESAAITRFNDLAVEEGFDVAYPQQNVTPGTSAPAADGNGIGCWNWFLPQDQSRDAGEPAAIAAVTREVMATEAIDPDRVYVEGISAGADMAVILGATYPDLYAAVGALAGCAYRTCGDATGALTHDAMRDNARVVPMFVENGTADTLNNVAMAEGLVTSWLGSDLLVDPDAGIDAVPDDTQTHGTDQTPKPGSGDLCIHNNTLTCPGGAVGFQGTYPYTVVTYDDVDGCDVLDLWLIHGMQHAYPNAPYDGPYTDPLGPDITTAAWNFFSSHPMHGGCLG